MRKQTTRLESGDSTRLDLYHENRPSRMLLVHQQVNRVLFSRLLLALIASWTLIASRHAVGESRRMSKTCGSAYPRMPLHPVDFWRYSCPRFLSTSTNRDCMTRSCTPCFFRVRQMTLASAGGITLAAAFDCQALHCLEPASRNNSFSRPCRPCHCFLWFEQLSPEMRRAKVPTR